MLGGSAFLGRVKGTRTDVIRQASPKSFHGRVQNKVSAIDHLRHYIVDSVEEVEPLQVRAEAPA